MGQLTRRISPITLFMLSMNGIIGSGWLLAPFYAAKIAGPAALLSWIVGGLAVMLIAYTFAELSTMFPVAGGTAQIPQLSHGTFASFILGWIAWLTSVLMAPIEVQAVLLYASLFFPALMHSVGGVPMLSSWGYVWAAILMVGLCIMNVASYRGLMRFNFAIFIFKFSIILLSIFAIFHIRFSPANFDGLISSATSFHGWQAILSAVATGGVILAFNGFKSGVELAGEAKNLSVAIPLSTVGSVAACLIVYLALQVVFIGALDPVSFQNGWEHLSYTGDVGPFLGLAAGLGLIWLLKLLYANSVVSPLGAGLIYVTSTARIVYAMSKMGYLPKAFSRLNRQHLPVWAIVINFAFGMLSFLPLPGWQSMVNFLVSAIVITYAMGPIALMCLRLSLPNQPRPFRLPAAKWLCLLAFYFCNLFSYWTGWDTISKLAIALSCGIFIFFMAYLRGTVKVKSNELKTALWIVPYLSGLVGISFLGAFGGMDYIPFGWDFIVIGLFSAGIFHLAVNSRAVINAENVTDLLINESMVLEYS